MGGKTEGGRDSRAQGVVECDFDMHLMGMEGCMERCMIGQDDGKTWPAYVRASARSGQATDHVRCEGLGFASFPASTFLRNGEQKAMAGTRQSRVVSS